MCRIISSPKIANALNSLQKTRWTVDPRMPKIIKATLSEVVNRRIVNRLQISIDEEGQFVADIASKSSDKMLPDWQSIEEWKKEIGLAEVFLNDESFNATFYHSWSTDWRGRMYSTSKMLTPQGDDISRGLIRFKDAQKLDEDGWEYLGLYTAALWKGRLNNIREEQDLPQGKTRAELKKIMENPGFRAELADIATNIVDNPLYRFEDWGEGDVFASKSEGFLRLSATLAFVDALNQGQVGAECNLPVVLDGSCNGYQHLAALMRDDETAENVNVIGSEQLIADLYQKVANQVRDTFEDNLVKYLKDKISRERRKEKNAAKAEDREPEYSFANLFNEVLQKLENDNAVLQDLCRKLTNRKVAKVPVMTMGYGAGPGSMTEALLTHNGESREKGGKVSWIEREGEPIIACAHPMSLLGPIMQDFHAPEAELPIAKFVIRQYRKALNEIVPVYEQMTDNLKKLVSKKREYWLPEGFWQEDGWGMLSSWDIPAEKHEKDWDSEDWKKWKNGMAEQSQRWVSRSIHPPVEKEGEVESSQLWKWFDKQGLEFPELDSFEGDRTPNQENRTHQIRWIRAINIAKEKLDPPVNEPVEWVISEDSPSLDPGNIRVKNFVGKTKRDKRDEPEHWRSRRVAQLKQRYQGEIQSIFGISPTDSEVLFVKSKPEDEKRIWEQICRQAGLPSDVEIQWNRAKPHYSTLSKIPEPHRAMVKKLTKTTIKKLTVSRKTIDTDGHGKPIESVSDEVSGIAPSFVHSHDASHMRMVINHLRHHQQNKDTPIQFWSVHDAFGTHPNDIRKLREIVSQKFARTHTDLFINDTENDNVCFGPLDKLHFQIIGKRSDSIQKTGDEATPKKWTDRIESNSPYLVWY